MCSICMTSVDSYLKGLFATIDFTVVLSVILFHFCQSAKIIMLSQL